MGFLSRGWADTARVYQSRIGAYVGLPILFGLIAGGAALVGDSPLLVAICAAAPSAIAFFGILIFQVARAPFRQRDDALQDLQAIQRERETFCIAPVGVASDPEHEYPIVQIGIRNDGRTWSYAAVVEKIEGVEYPPLGEARHLQWAHRGNIIVDEIPSREPRVIGVCQWIIRQPPMKRVEVAPGIRDRIPDGPGSLCVRLVDPTGASRNHPTYCAAPGAATVTVWVRISARDRPPVEYSRVAGVDIEWDGDLESPPRLALRSDWSESTG